MVQFERESWKEFRTLDGLCRMAGVSRNRIAAVVAKELVDNALDESPIVNVELLGPNGFFVQDDGRGIDLDIVAELFSIKRPQRSTKFLRLPTRGALGNGLRVVASAVLCTQGQLIVSTRGQQLKLTPRDDGSTSTEVIGNYAGKGTRVEVQLGSDTPVDGRTLRYAKVAIWFQQGVCCYAEKTNAYWYTSRDLYELFNSAADEDMTVRKLLTEFSGGDDPTVSMNFKDKRASDITLQEAKVLLQRLQKASKPVKASRLGKSNDISGGYYAKIEDEFKSEANGELAWIPFVVEAWANFARVDALTVVVNRTPITGEIAIRHDKSNLYISGCNISEEGFVQGVVTGKRSMDIVVSILTPYVPKTSEGKNPDLVFFRTAICDAIKKAANKATRANPENTSTKSQKDIVLENLDKAIETTSGNHKYRVALRQLYYAVRPIVKDEGAGELRYPNFEKIVTAYESELGHDLPGIYRDPRGSIYHPHKHEKLTLGGLMVESYRPPDWTYNKILFIEKEGFFQTLIDEHWPERHDCALISSKGQGTRAAKDLIDSLEDIKENVTVYAIHDADAAGTMIYQSMQDETKSRDARKVEIINLGLEPWEGLKMDLEVEPVEYKTVQPVARYVYDKNPDWAKWLQTHRIELNAMTTPDFLVWLTAKMEDTDKLIPPQDVIAAELKETILESIKERLTTEILEEADLTGRVDDEFEDLANDIDTAIETLNDHIASELHENPTMSWKDIVVAAGEDICGSDA